MKWSSITHPSSGYLALTGLAVTLTIGIIVVYGRLHEHTAHVPAAQPQVLDSSTGACTVARLRLACDRAESAGWPSCLVLDGLGTVVTFETISSPGGTGPEWEGHGAIGRRADGRLALVLDPDHSTCSDGDLAIEHELICHLYGVGHVGLTGSLCAETRSRMGSRIPRRTP